VVAWRVFRPTIANGATPEVPPELVLTESDVEILNRLAGTTYPPPKPAVAHYLLGSAKLGGYLAAKDPPPGSMVIWRELTSSRTPTSVSAFSSRVVGN
jgi:hypothetical protein